ncbi:hypothetical protein HQ529_05800 [Candidatus Woesearchaeota archaeon]|nr:hypothetical protein [Candidatus Woesearchaeota archaeon]
MKIDNIVEKSIEVMQEDFIRFNVDEDNKKDIYNFIREEYRKYSLLQKRVKNIAAQKRNNPVVEHVFDKTYLYSILMGYTTVTEEIKIGKTEEVYVDTEEKLYLLKMKGNSGGNWDDTFLFNIYTGARSRERNTRDERKNQRFYSYKKMIDELFKHPDICDKWNRKGKNRITYKNDIYTHKKIY